MQNTEIFQLILEQFQDGIVILDADDKIIFINEMAQNIRNVSINIVGNNIMQCHSKNSQEKVIRALKYLRENGKSFTRMVIDNNNDKI